jgi:hypothetical protein
MNTDAFFTTGKQHNVCQDYAQAAENKVALSDGCSSSPHTDFGARFLCRLSLQYGMSEGATRARALLEPLGLPVEALDATLILAQLRDTVPSVLVFTYGDGVVVGRRRDGTHLIFNRSFPSGAPLYPNYELDPARRDRYVQEFGTEEVLTEHDGPRVSEKKTTLLEEGGWRCPFASAEFYASIFDLVLIFSDGVLSFRKPAKNGLTEPVPMTEVVAEMLNIKGFAGEFVTRRAKRFLKDAAAKGWHHDDDFSVAGIYLGDAP